MTGRTIKSRKEMEMAEQKKHTAFAAQEKSAFDWP